MAAMRITAEAKIETRQAIVRAAKKLFASKGWESTTTRRIAEAAGIATGTLFNYFESKEAIVAELISEGLARAQEEVDRRRNTEQTLEEELFSLIWTELASLSDLRKFLPAAAETIFSPVRRHSPDSRGESIRNKHVEAVEGLITRHDAKVALPPLTMQLYWTLYLGVFAHWASDKSPNQEDTMALLDQSLKLFAALLNGLGAERKTNREPTTQRTHRRASKRKRSGGKDRQR